MCRQEWPARQDQVAVATDAVMDVHLEEMAGRLETVHEQTRLVVVAGSASVASDFLQANQVGLLGLHRPRPVGERRELAHEEPVVAEIVNAVKIAARKHKDSPSVENDPKYHEEMGKLYRQHVLKEQPTLSIIGLSGKRKNETVTIN